MSGRATVAGHRHAARGAVVRTATPVFALVVASLVSAGCGDGGGDGGSADDANPAPDRADAISGTDVVASSPANGADTTSGRNPDDPPTLPTPIVRLGGSTMGTSWSALVAGRMDDAERDALAAELERELERIDGTMSTWNPDSELSRFNARSDAEPVALDPDTLGLVDAALAITAETDGAYDVALGALVDLWGFGSGEAPDVPTEAAIASAREATGEGALVRAGDTLAKRDPRVQVDLSSIAKGHAVDRLGEIVAASGRGAYLVEIGGEVRTRGEPSPGEPWRVGIERPDGPPDEGLALADAHVASSGSYRNVRQVNGRVVSHILDGRTGRPIAHALVAVTVLHPDSTALADAWATAFLVLGPEDARARAEALALPVQLVTADGDGFATWRSPAFAERVVTAGR